MTTPELRRRVLYLYKELVYMGKDYPAGYPFFVQKLRQAFRKKAGISDSAEIEKGLLFGEFIKKELVALYSLKKYRFLKKNYYDKEKQLALEYHEKETQLLNLKE